MESVDAVERSEVKRCSKCTLVKPVSSFWKNNNSRDGYQHTCIDCQKARWEKDVSRQQEVKARFQERKMLYNDNHINKYLWFEARKRAKEKGLEFTIEPRHIIVPDICPISLVAMERNRGKLGPNSYSLDRIDSSKGYIPGNVAVISFKANQIKNNFSLEELERLLIYMKGEVSSVEFSAHLV